VRHSTRLGAEDAARRWPSWFQLRSRRRIVIRRNAERLAYQDAQGYDYQYERYLECELDRDWSLQGAEEVIADGVAPGPGYVDLVDVGLADPPQIGSELLEVGLPVLEVLADAADQGLSAAVGSCSSRRRMMTVGGACSSR
jgi:hypothetical protein